MHRNNTHISLVLSPTTKGTKCVCDYTVDTDSREAQHSQTVTNGNSERLPCPLQLQQVGISCVFCISLSCTVINLYMTPRGQEIMVYFQMTHEQVCRKKFVLLWKQENGIFSVADDTSSGCWAQAPGKGAGNSSAWVQGPVETLEMLKLCSQSIWLGLKLQQRSRQWSCTVWIIRVCVQEE